MKKWSIIAGLLLSIPALAQTGYEIKVTFKPFKNQFIYLGHYAGKTLPIVDSVKLDANSTGIFKGKNVLPGGIYLVGYPNKQGFFEILLDKQQKFSIVADTATLKKGIQFQNNPDNTLFNGYQLYMTEKGKEINNLRQQLGAATTAADSAAINAKLLKTDSSVKAYRENIIKKNPSSFLTTLLQAMREPELPVALQQQRTKADSLAAYRYYKDRFWNGINFWDNRMLQTPFFEDKLDKYFTQLVVPDADSVNKELDWMLGYASINKDMYKFLLSKFVNRYINQKYMYEDAIFVHLFEKHLAAKKPDWYDDKQYKTITDRAYSMMANIVGTPAADIVLPDSLGVIRSMYADSSRFTIVCFWDPTCGHCKEVLPKLDSMYRAKWKAMGVNIFAVAKETDGSQKDWLGFIGEKNLQNWTHVYYSKEEEKKKIQAGIPGYSQLYDVLTFPTLYLLDKDKRIIAKKLSWEQTDEVLQIKMKAQ